MGKMKHNKITADHSTHPVGIWQEYYSDTKGDARKSIQCDNITTSLLLPTIRKKVMFSNSDF